jgi:hypothetical protein
MSFPLRSRKSPTLLTHLLIVVLAACSGTAVIALTATSLSAAFLSYCVGVLVRLVRGVLSKTSQAPRMSRQPESIGSN